MSVDAFGEQLKLLNAKIYQYDNVHGCRDSDLGRPPRCEHQDIYDGEYCGCWTCESDMKRSALEAGIPLAVYEGREKLSRRCCEAMTNQPLNREEMIDAGRGYLLQ